jgi:CheY-like chemotaxis protein
MTAETGKLVLMADDDEEDCYLASEAFLNSGARAGFHHVQDGAVLMEYLKGRLCSDPEGLPDLILLDLNMPGKDGRETLQEIRSNPALHSIPIVILTTSYEEKDIEFSMKAGADSFMTKPATFTEWEEKMKSLVKCWLED